jgi:hypothetical protein
MALVLVLVVGSCSKVCAIEHEHEHDYEHE